MNTAEIWIVACDAEAADWSDVDDETARACSALFQKNLGKGRTVRKIGLFRGGYAAFAAARLPDEFEFLGRQHTAGQTLGVYFLLHGAGGTPAGGGPRTHARLLRLLGVLADLRKVEIMACTLARKPTVRDVVNHAVVESSFDLPYASSAEEMLGVLATPDLRQRIVAMKGMPQQAKDAATAQLLDEASRLAKAANTGMKSYVAAFCEELASPGTQVAGWSAGVWVDADGSKQYSAPSEPARTRRVARNERTSREYESSKKVFCWQGASGGQVVPGTLDSWRAHM